MWIKDVKLTNEGKSNRVMMPVRIIMNNQTLSVFEGVEFNKLVHSYNLKETQFSKILERKGCFTLEAPSSSSKLVAMSFCPFGMSSSEEWQNEWDYDFNLFKNQCSTNQGEVEFTLDGAEEGKINNEITQLKADIIKQKENKISQELEEQAIFKEKGELDDTELSAIEKEFDIELMIQKEEEKRERKMEEELQIQIENEKEKRNCLLKSIREKTRENQYNMLTEELKQEITDKKKETQISIAKRRSEMQELVQRMKERAERKRKKLQQKLNLVRSEITEDIQSETKKSNYDCLSNIKSGGVDNEIYCNSRFPTNPIKNNECKMAKDREKWCSFCCSNENGSMYQDTRMSCLQKCRNEEEKKVDLNETTNWYIPAFTPTKA